MSRLLSWVYMRTLWVVDPSGRTRALRAAGTGVYDLQWSRDGRHVLYLRDNAIWLIGVSGGPPVKIVGSGPTIFTGGLVWIPWPRGVVRHVGLV